LGLIKRLGERNVKIHDIVCEDPQQDFPYPDKKGFNSLYQPNMGLFLYGMQLPHQFNRDLLLKSMIYLFHKKIYNIADLQGCADAINRHNPSMDKGVGCNPYDRECEPRMWERARFLTIQQKTEPETECGYIQGADKMNLGKLTPDEIGYLDKGTYYDIKIKDMTAGGLSSWIEISTIKDVSKPKNTIVVHCLAGAGRTGSVLLYLLMRDSGNILNDAEKKRYITEIKDKLAKPHFGLSNIAEVVGMLRAYFVNYSYNVKFATRELFKIGSRIMDKQTEQMLRDKGVNEDKIKTILEQGIDTDMYEYLMSKINITELSELDARQNESQASSSLLRQRLNRIFFFLAKEFKVSPFYTYARPTSQVLMLPNDEFSNPVLRYVSDWDNYDRNEVRKWLN
jgi:SOS response regulatory protein OraA/RecX